MFVIAPIDRRVRPLALQIHALQIAAYEQEAQLLGIDDFPPLRRGLDDVLESTDEFIGAFEDERLAGVLSMGADDEGRGVNIASLVVHPECQRRGIARALLKAAIERHAGAAMTVQTASANLRALALYAQFGFVPFRRWCPGGGTLELVKLGRPPGPAPALGSTIAPRSLAHPPAP